MLHLPPCFLLTTEGLGYTRATLQNQLWGGACAASPDHRFNFTCCARVVVLFLLLWIILLKGHQVAVAEGGGICPVRLIATLVHIYGGVHWDSTQTNAPARPMDIWPWGLVLLQLNCLIPVSPMCRLCSKNDDAASAHVGGSRGSAASCRPNSVHRCRQCGSECLPHGGGGPDGSDGDPPSSQTEADHANGHTAIYGLSG